MATMTKEKKREKKKSKPKIDIPSAQPIEPVAVVNNIVIINKQTSSWSEAAGSSKETVSEEKTKSIFDIKEPESACTNSVKDFTIKNKDTVIKDCIVNPYNMCQDIINERAYIDQKSVGVKQYIAETISINPLEITQTESTGDTYEEVRKRLEIIQIPRQIENIDVQELEDSLNCAHAYIKTEDAHDLNIKEENVINQESTENAMPSAPVFEEDIECAVMATQEEIKTEIQPKATCMPLEEAVRLFGGSEMAKVQSISQREEALVAAGPISGPEHPLVDLLSTFSNSLKALDREKIQFKNSQAEEQKYRSTLWQIEKQKLNLTEKCDCGSNVYINAIYQHAKLMMERLPIARVKLEALLRDIQESYCHYLHDALLAYYQINEFIVEISKANKADIREALSLILQDLRLNDSGPVVLTDALQRWAEDLVIALVDGKDLSQLLFVLHHLFRQTRSVSWASRVMRLQVDEDARALAVLAVLLQHSIPERDTVRECTAELNMDELWEEVDRQGAGGAVSEGSLREKDLLDLLQAFPLRRLLARILPFPHTDVERYRSYEWAWVGEGRGVVRAACGVRVLAGVLRDAAHAHARYLRLRVRLARLLQAALRRLATLHVHCRFLYSKELEPIVTAELEACFAAGLSFVEPSEMKQLPATLLNDDTVKEYCLALICAMHGNESIQLECLSTVLPAVPCPCIVGVVTAASVFRTQDHQLAGIVMDFLFQTGIKRVTPSVKCGCDVAARECLPELLRAHPYMRINALRTFSDLSQVETLDVSAISSLSLNELRQVSSEELVGILQQFSSRCPHLLQPLLMALDYTPYTGISHEVQLSIGAWLVSWQGRSPTAEWAWQVLHRLALHRSQWGSALDAPHPDLTDTDNLFAIAFALLSSSWGHCIPLICEFGVDGLLKLALARVEDAVHCLQYIVLVLSHSPESISLTPKFTELMSVILKASPTLMQRALGCSSSTGLELLMKLIIKQLTTEHSVWGQGGVVRCWLQLVWQPALPAAAASLLDLVLLCARDLALVGTHATTILQEAKAATFLQQGVQQAACMPLACELLLRHNHSPSRYNHLLDAVWRQQLNNRRIHVDNALKEIGVKYRSDELVIIMCGQAALAAPLHHPALLLLWRLFFHLYLQKPPSSNGKGPVIGPLLFSGIINSRTLIKLKNHLQNSQSYHKAESEVTKAKLKQISELQVPKTKTGKTKKVDNDFLPTITIADLTGEPLVEDEDCEEESTGEEKVIRDDSRRDLEVLCSYHLAAADLCKTYYNLLEKGEDVEVEPWYAKLAAFIPEREFQCALYFYKKTIFPCKSEPACPSRGQGPAPELPLTPFQCAEEALLDIEDNSDKSSSRPTTKSLTKNIDFKDLHSLEKLADKHFKQLQVIANQWSSEVNRISSLDNRVLELVRGLRVPRPLPPIKQACPNKCKPITFVLSVEEWCLNTGVEREINDNRLSAKAMLQQLTRPRYEAAQTAALLNAIARGIGSAQTATWLARRAWQTAGALAGCSLVSSTLSALLNVLAERWICHDGRLVVSLLEEWRDSQHAVQQSLCGLLLSPRALPAQDWPDVYAAVVNCTLTPQTLFSYLSKFELSRWNESCKAVQRSEMLSVLMSAAYCLEKNATSTCIHDETQDVVIELLGVHTACVLSSESLRHVLVSCVRGRCSPIFFRHLVAAVPHHASLLNMDQLCKLLNSLGEVWWECRNDKISQTNGVAPGLAPHMACLLSSLQRAYVAAARELSYTPERIAPYAWMSLRKSWSGWLLSHHHPDMQQVLPDCRLTQHYDYEDTFLTMVKAFVDTILQIIVECPGIEIFILRQIFPWSVQPHNKDMLLYLRALPWHKHAWIDNVYIYSAVQICQSDDMELKQWCVYVTAACSATDWLGGAGAGGGEWDEDTSYVVPNMLASLLYLFLNMPFTEETLSEACLLPWWRLQQADLEQALQSFLADNHNTNVPYHTIPQFKVILSASCMVAGEGAGAGAAWRGAGAGSGRAACVAHATRALAAPTLHHHVSALCTFLLTTIDNLAPHLDDTGSELVELLSGAMVILCMEPAAQAALPAWEAWVRGTASERGKAACVAAVSRLTHATHFARLADVSVATYLALTECVGWAYVASSWAECCWREAHVAVSHAALHAAYGVMLAHAHAHAHTHAHICAAARALQATTLHFVENEVIISLWICYLTRMGVTTATDESGAECRQAVTTLLTAWGEQRRSILRVITLQGNNHIPTNKHRVLCHLGLCLLSGSDSASRAYRASCTELIGSIPSDVIKWADSPTLTMMPRLAVTMFPKHAKYFQVEIELTNEVNLQST